MLVKTQLGVDFCSSTIYNFLLRPTEYYVQVHEEVNNNELPRGGESEKLKKGGACMVQGHVFLK